MARRKRNVIDSTDNALDNIVNNSIESPDEKLRRLKLGAMVDGGEKEEEQPDTWTSASEIHNEGADALSKSNADDIQEYNTDGIFQKFNAANDAKFRNEQIIQNFTPEQKTAYHKLTTDEAKNKYLYDIYSKYSLDTDTDTPGVATGYDATEERPNMAHEVYNETPRIVNGQSGSSSSSVTNFGNMTDQKKGILNIIENGIYGGTPLADEYQEINPEPVAPTYDPRREKALQWQKAIVSLGKLAGVISDVKTVNRNGIVNQREQGTTELNAIDAGIANLRATFAQQYDDYLEADKLYRKELYQAYRQDIANKRDLAKSLIPQYKESFNDSYSYSGSLMLDAAKIRNAGKAKSSNVKMVPIPLFGKNSSGGMNTEYVPVDVAKAVAEDAMQAFMMDSNAVSSFVAQTAQNFNYNINGFDLSKLKEIDNDTSYTPEEKKSAKLKCINDLFNYDKTAKDKIFDYLSKHPRFAIVYAAKFGDAELVNQIESELGLTHGSLRLGSEDQVWMVDNLVYGVVNGKRLCDDAHVNDTRRTLMELTPSELRGVFNNYFPDYKDKDISKVRERFKWISGNNKDVLYTEDVQRNEYASESENGGGKSEADSELAKKKEELENAKIALELAGEEESTARKNIEAEIAQLEKEIEELEKKK